MAFCVGVAGFSFGIKTSFSGFLEDLFFVLNVFWLLSFCATVRGAPAGLASLLAWVLSAKEHCFGVNKAAFLGARVHLFGRK